MLKTRHPEARNARHMRRLKLEASVATVCSQRKRKHLKTRAFVSWASRNSLASSGVTVRYLQAQARHIKEGHPSVASAYVIRMVAIGVKRPTNLPEPFRSSYRDWMAAITRLPSCCVFASVPPSYSVEIPNFCASCRSTGKTGVTGCPSCATSMGPVDIRLMTYPS